MEKRKVLVPVDDSEFCRQIFPILTKFLDPDSNELILLRVGEQVTGHVGAPPRPAAYDPSMTSYGSAQDVEFSTHPIYASQERDSALAAFISEMQSEVRSLQEAGFVVHFDMRFGDRGQAIVNYTNHNEVDLVAMTTHWRTGVNRLLFGNTVQYIVPRISAPLLMLRPEDGHASEASGK